MTNDPMINVSRVETRVASGGHDVDKDKIISRYYKSLANIKQLIELCDILHVYDNTVEPIRIIRKHKTDFSIFPNEQWPVERIIELIS
jgi:predicted ABC-type ATPase